MKIVGSFLIVAIFLFAGIAHAGGVEQGKVVVKFKADSTEQERTLIKSSHKLKNNDGKQEMANTEILTIEDGRKPEEVARALSSEKAVEFAEPLRIRKPQALPNDSYFGTQWYLRKIKMQEAWDATSQVATTAAIRVAIVDTGIVSNNPDINYSRVFWGCDWTRSGCQKPSDSTPTWSHGTALAGVIGATQNNGVAIAGISNRIELMVEKVCGDICRSDWIANGITHAARNGAKIINLSLGGYEYSALEYSAIEEAYSRGVLLVCAIGNDGKYNLTNPYYPALFRECMTVGATDTNDKIVNVGDPSAPDWGSNFGVNISVMAPGTHIFSLNNASGTSVVAWSGTSFSTAQVSGLAAEIWAKCPTVTFHRIRAIIQNSAVPLGADYLYGHGRIDAKRAIDTPCVPLDVRGLPPKPNICRDGTLSCVR